MTEEETQGEMTVLLRRLRVGDAAAADELLPLVYGELHRIARRQMAGQRPDHTLQATALLNEAWMRLASSNGADFQDRGHFLAVAARAMRSVVVDHARRRGALRAGGGGARVELDQVVELLERSATDLCALDEALDELSGHDAKLGRIVELRFFGGLGNPDIAEVLGIPLRTVERGWATARAWLHAYLTRGA